MKTYLQSSNILTQTINASKKIYKYIIYIYKNLI